MRKSVIRRCLACADDITDKAIARRLRTTKTTVAKWRLRFNARRLAGLYDEPRVGAPRTVSDDAVETVIVKTLIDAALTVDVAESMRAVCSVGLEF